MHKLVRQNHNRGDLHREFRPCLCRYRVAIARGSDREQGVNEGKAYEYEGRFTHRYVRGN